MDDAALRRFFIPPELVYEKKTRLPDAEAHHLRDVLRIREGEMVEIFDGKGNGWSGAVEFRNCEVFVCGLSPIHSRRRPETERLSLALAIIKPSRFEWALEKATELGVDEILPLYTSRSENRVSGEKFSARFARWDRILKEASKQCRRLDVPRINVPLLYHGFLSSEGYSVQNKILFHEKSNEPWLCDRTETGRDTIICIGPEGGWTEDEIESAKNSGCSVVRLGTHVLRAETAAVAALSIFQHRI